jgi:hypothetical protein
MLLIAEIILTVFAWRKGWKWYSLIPGGSALFLGFCVGLSNPNGSLGSAIWVDVLATIALIVMVSVKPKEKE